MINLNDVINLIMTAELPILSIVGRNSPNSLPSGRTSCSCKIQKIYSLMLYFLNKQETNRHISHSHMSKRSLHHWIITILYVYKFVNLSERVWEYSFGIGDFHNLGCLFHGNRKNIANENFLEKGTRSTRPLLNTYNYSWCCGFFVIFVRYLCIFQDI